MSQQLLEFILKLLKSLVGIVHNAKNSRKNKNMTGQSFITDDDDKEWEYELKTDPPQAMFWSTHKIKKSEIKILNCPDRKKAAELRQMLFEIFEIERKSAANTD